MKKRLIKSMFQLNIITVLKYHKSIRKRENAALVEDVFLEKMINKILKIIRYIN